MQTRKAECPDGLPMQTRAAPVSSVDVEKRTVDVVFSTGASVRRQRWIGWDTVVPFDEILQVSRDAVNLDRLNAGAPVLDSHSAWSTSSQVGVVENARVEGGKALATLRFPAKGVDAAADRMFAMVEQRIIRNVSVGYSIDEAEVKAPSKAGEIEQRIVKRWTPMEISFVTIPADAGAQVRKLEEAARYPFQVSNEPAAASAEIDAALAAAARMRMRMQTI